MKNFKKITSIICSALVVGTMSLSCISASAITETVEFGASWYHDASLSGLQKKCVSNLTSSTNDHSSTAIVGENSSYSGETAAGTTSYATAYGGWTKEANAYYNIW